MNIHIENMRLVTDRNVVAEFSAIIDDWRVHRCKVVKTLAGDFQAVVPRDRDGPLVIVPQPAWRLLQTAALTAYDNVAPEDNDGLLRMLGAAERDSLAIAGL